MTLSKLIDARLVLAAGALALAACSTPQPNTALTDAQSAYSTAASDPKVASLAHNELESAREALKASQDTWNNRGDKADVDHYAYIAKQRSATAQEVARRRVAEDRIQNAARVITLEEVLFETGKADLDSGATRAVGDVAIYLKDHPDRRAIVTGYTDSTGSAKLNDKLAADRAAAVRKALIAQGIEPARVDTASVGPAQPVEPNSTESGRQHNRRAEVAIVESGTSGVGTSFTGDVPKNGTSKAPDATIHLTGGNIAAGIGYNWGSGTLTYQGKNYPITVKGLSVGDVGASKVDATGEVYNLKFVDDIEGNFSAMTAGATVGVGGSATAMRNEHGVTIRLISERQGLQFQFAPTGMEIHLKQAS